MVFSSCENEGLTAENSATSIAVAKSWYEGFKAKENFQPIFSDLIYNWQDVSITMLTDGTQAITVPVLYPNQSLDYYGHKIMCLYPKKSGDDYDVTLFELIPNPKKVQSRQDTIDWTAFDGYIIQWDLVHGFVKGSKFEQNLAVIPINVKIKDSGKRNNNTNKEAPIIALDEVVVEPITPIAVAIILLYLHVPMRLSGVPLLEVLPIVHTVVEVVEGEM